MVAMAIKLKSRLITSDMYTKCNQKIVRTVQEIYSKTLYACCVVCVCVQVCGCAGVCVCACVHVCVSVCAHVCVHVCV